MPREGTNVGMTVRFRCRKTNLFVISPSNDVGFFRDKQASRVQICLNLSNLVRKGQTTIWICPENSFQLKGPSEYDVVDPLLCCSAKFCAYQHG